MRWFNGRELAVLVGIAGVLVAASFLVSAFKPQATYFQSLREFKGFALSKGFFFPEQPLLLDNFFIADHPLNGEASRVLRSMDKRDSGLTPAWRGLLWVCAQRSRFESEIQSSTVGGKSRIWGNLLVAGDEELMDRIERLCR